MGCLALKRHGNAVQYLSGKLGIATGLSLPEVIREKLKKKKYIIPYWLAAEATSGYGLG